MRFRSVIAGAFLCLAATGCGTMSASASQAPASIGSAYIAHVPDGPPATVSAAVPVLFDCLSHPVVKPGTYTLTCADAGSVLAGLSWTRWTSQQAVATGVHELNNCTPNCAEGKFVRYPATITFWRPEPLAGHAGERFFSRVTVRYTSSHRPPMYLNYNTLVKNPAQWSEVLGS